MCACVKFTKLTATPGPLHTHDPSHSPVSGSLYSYRSSLIISENSDGHQRSLCYSVPLSYVIYY